MFYDYVVRELLSNEKRYITGLDQLAIAAKSVAALQEALEILQPKLAAGAAAVAETTAKVEKEKEGVALVEAEVLVDQAAAEEQVTLPVFKSRLARMNLGVIQNQNSSGLTLFKKLKQLLAF